MAHDDRIYHTYALANPLKNGQYFYIGFTGRDERIDEHLDCKKSDKNYHKKNTIKEIQRAGLEVIIVKILENVDKQTAIDKEIESIALYGRRDKGTGILTNMTDGGEGNIGGVWTNESREKLSKSMVGENNPRFNTIMINNGIDYMAHDKDEPIPNGYQIGGKSLDDGANKGELNPRFNTVMINDNNGNYKAHDKDEPIPNGWKIGGRPKPEGAHKGEKHPRYNTIQIKDGNGNYQTIKKDENIPEGWKKGGRSFSQPKGKFLGHNNPMFGKTGENNPNFGKKAHINIATLEKRRIKPELALQLGPEWILQKEWKKSNEVF